jgi:choline dehydrogenase-like flavoprotein
MALRTQPTARQDVMASWWPSRYGADDQAGALNEITPDKVLEAIGLVRQGLVYDLAHQNGTVRFGTDPATSAFDLNCKLHDLDNLYVVDSSFFVSSTAVNPTPTIIANALRVADHIAGRLRATGQAEAQPLVTAHA